MGTIETWSRRLAGTMAVFLVSGCAQTTAAGEEAGDSQQALETRTETKTLSYDTLDSPSAGREARGICQKAGYSEASVITLNKLNPASPWVTVVVMCSRTVTVAPPPAAEAIALDDARVFDAGYYLSVHSDVRAAGVPARSHWLNHGVHEGRVSPPRFAASVELNDPRPSTWRAKIDNQHSIC